MRNRTQLWIGVALLAIGVLYLGAVLLQIDLRGSFWPVLLILLGVFLLLRPSFGGSGRDDFRFFGDVVRRGPWQVTGRDFWSFIGDVKLDLTEASLPEGETVIRMTAFIGDMKIIAPSDMAIAISTSGLISDARLFGEKRDGFFAPVDMSTPGYDQAVHKLRLEVTGFISGLKVRAG